MNKKVRKAINKLQEQTGIYAIINQIASDLNITPNRLSRILNEHEHPRELIEKIGRYLGLKPEHVNKNYKQGGTKNKGKILLIRGKKVIVLSEKKR